MPAITATQITRTNTQAIACPVPTFIPSPCPEGLLRAREMRKSRQQQLLQQLTPILDKASNAVLEIGCGHGHWLASYAQAHPGQTCIGLDIISQRVAKAQNKASRQGLDNLVFVKAEAIEFLEMLPPQVSWDWVIVLFPDPWPKSRHHRRRLIQPAFIDLIAKSLSPSARLCFRTDHQDYFEWANKVIHAHPGWTLDSPTIWPWEAPTLFQNMMHSWQSLSAQQTPCSDQNTTGSGFPIIPTPPSPRPTPNER